MLEYTGMYNVECEFYNFCVCFIDNLIGVIRMCDYQCIITDNGILFSNTCTYRFIHILLRVTFIVLHDN